MQTASIVAKAIKIAKLHHLPLMLLRAFIIPLHCLQSDCLLRRRLAAQARVREEERRMYYL
jgi:hypothetical protein